MTEVTTEQKVQPPTVDQYGTQTSPGGYGVAVSSESGLSSGQTAGTVNGQEVNRPKDVPVELPYTPEKVEGNLRGGQGVRYQAEIDRSGRVTEQFTNSREMPGILTSRTDVPVLVRPDLHIAPQPQIINQTRRISTYEIERPYSKAIEVRPWTKKEIIGDIFGIQKVTPEPGMKYTQDILGFTRIAGKVDEREASGTYRFKEERLEQASKMLLFTPFVFGTPLKAGTVGLKGNKIQVSKEFSEYMNTQAEVPKKSSGSVMVPGSPFNKDPIMPGQALLKSNSGLGNRPIMPYERMAQEFLPESKDTTFISSTQAQKTYAAGVKKTRDIVQALNIDAGKQPESAIAPTSFFTGKVSKQTSRGIAFKELDKTWEARAASNTGQSSQKTAQGQIVLTKQKQIQVQVQVQKTAQKQAQMQSIKTVPFFQSEKLSYISAAQRMQSSQTQRTIQIQKTSPAQAQRQLMRQITGQTTGQKVVQGLKSGTIQIQTAKQVSGQLLKNVQMPKQKLATKQSVITISIPKLKVPTILKNVFKNTFENKKQRRGAFAWHVRNRLISIEDL